MGRVEFIKSDLFRYCGQTNLKSFLKVYIQNHGFRRQCFFRLVNGKRKGILRSIYSITQGSIGLPADTKVGYGLYIGHSGPIVINPNSVIGNNVNLSQFLSIGSNSARAAIIDDNVYVGPNVCLDYS